MSNISINNFIAEALFADLFTESTQPNELSWHNIIQARFPKMLGEITFTKEQLRAIELRYIGDGNSFAYVANSLNISLTETIGIFHQALLLIAEKGTAEFADVQIKHLVTNYPERAQQLILSLQKQVSELTTKQASIINNTNKPQGGLS